jgi:hypothetical protein
MLKVTLGSALGAAQGGCLVFAEEQVVYEDGTRYATNLFIGCQENLRNMGLRG